MFDKYNLRNIDFTLLFLVTSVVSLGVVMIGSADGWVLDPDNFFLDSMMKKQILGYVLGLGVIFFILLLNYDVLKVCVIPIYVIVFFLLVAVLIIGVGSEAEGDDVRRWINLFGGFTLQPSEFAKMAVILFLSWYVDLYQDKINRLPVLFIMGASILIPLYLVYKEPDLSTSIVIVSICFFVLFNGGLSWKYILPAVVIGTILVIVVYNDALSESPKILGTYQVERILSWRYPEKFQLETAYQTLQSMNAIGSGGILGVGLFHSSGTVPVATTDFIFGIIGEELGFLGALCLILLMILIFLRIILIAHRARDTFGRILCYGVATWLSIQSAIHIGVCTGALPNTGIPFPFVSYGLSSLVSSMIGIGLVLKVNSESKADTIY